VIPANELDPWPFLIPTLATLHLLQLAVAVGKLERQGDSVLPLQIAGGQQENMEKCMGH